jgi:hypothetical protein
MAMVREARFLSDDPGWVDPSRFIDDRDVDDADFEAPVGLRTSKRGRGRAQSLGDDERRDPRRKMDVGREGVKGHE